VSALQELFERTPSVPASPLTDLYSESPGARPRRGRAANRLSYRTLNRARARSTSTRRTGCSNARPAVAVPTGLPGEAVPPAPLDGPRRARARARVRSIAPTTLGRRSSSSPTSRSRRWCNECMDGPISRSPSSVTSPAACLNAIPRTMIESRAWSRSGQPVIRRPRSVELVARISRRSAVRGPCTVRVPRTKKPRIGPRDHRRQHPFGGAVSRRRCTSARRCSPTLIYHPEGGRRACRGPTWGLPRPVLTRSVSWQAQSSTHLCAPPAWTIVDPPGATCSPLGLSDPECADDPHPL